MARGLHGNERISPTAGLHWYLVEDSPKDLTGAYILLLQLESRLTTAEQDLLIQLCDIVANIMNNDTS